MKQLGLQRRGESEESIARRRGSRQGRESTLSFKPGTGITKKCKNRGISSPHEKDLCFPKRFGDLCLSLTEHERRSKCEREITFDGFSEIHCALGSLMSSIIAPTRNGCECESDIVNNWDPEWLIANFCVFACVLLLLLPLFLKTQTQMLMLSVDGPYLSNVNCTETWGLSNHTIKSSVCRRGRKKLKIHYKGCNVIYAAMSKGLKGIH